MSSRLSRRAKALGRAVQRLTYGLPKGTLSAHAPVAQRVGKGFESLEERRMFALLGIFAGIDYPELQVGPPGYLNYDAPASPGIGSLDIVSTVFAIQVDASSVIPVNTVVNEGARLQMTLNSTDGSFVSGVAGLDLTVDGDVTIGGNTYTGRLLEAEVLNWGWNSTGGVFDFRLALVGGSLMADPAFANRDLGIRLTRENVTGVARPTTLPNGFGSDWGGLAKGIIGPLDPLTPYSSIAGNVYYDEDDDGIFDPGELPIPGTTVTLTGTNDLGLPVNRTTVKPRSFVPVRVTVVPGRMTSA